MTTNYPKCISGWIQLCRDDPKFQDQCCDQYSTVGDLGGDLVMTVFTPLPYSGNILVSRGDNPVVSSCYHKLRPVSGMFTFPNGLVYLYVIVVTITGTYYEYSILLPQVETVTITVHCCN
jgi:hypothetical protein